MEKMTEEKYLNERLDGQLAWYDGKSTWNQKGFRWTQLVQIVAAALIPFVSGLGGLFPEIPFFQQSILQTVGILGMAIAVATAVGSLFKFQENWVQYRTTAEQLRHERFMFLTGVEPYNGSNAFALLVQRIEGLISKENAVWAKSAQAKVEHKTDAKPATNAEKETPVQVSQ